MLFYDPESRAETLRQLQSLVDALAKENHILATDLSAISRRQAVAEDESGALLKLCVAHERLAGAGSEADVIAAVDEIASAMVGCEEFALIERTSAGTLRTLHRGPLLDLEPEALPGAREEILAAFRPAAQPVLRDALAADAAPGISAIVPLRHDEETVAVLVLCRSLSHRPERDAVDDALLNLLARIGGRTLRVARMLEASRA